MNPHTFSVFCIKKNKKKRSQIMTNNLRLFVEKKYPRFHNNFFTWHWLTKYTFSSINRNPQAPKKIVSIVLHIFIPFAFSNIYVSHLKNNKKKPSTKKCV